MCKYHEVYDRNNEFFRINLEVTSFEGVFTYKIWNTGTSPLCDRIVICSSSGTYRKKLTEPIFPGESLSVLKKGDTCEATAFAKVDDGNWVVSDTVKAKSNDWWVYNVAISNHDGSVIFIGNSICSKVTAKNIVVRFKIIDNPVIVPVFSTITKYEKDEHNLYLYVDSLEPGEIKMLGLENLNSGYIDTVNILVKSDTPFKEGYDGFTMAR